ncbi:helix-turn-helix domain-containing protein [Oleiphilus sp. HI0125]
MHTHRNTLLRRLTKAQELLPRPLEENLIQVGAALELSSWLS